MSITIDAALRDKNLLGAALGDVSSWSRWLTVLRAAFGLGLSAQDRPAFVEIAGDRAPPSHRVSEFWAVVGRRSGKTRMAAAVACYIGAIEQHSLVPGEIGYVLLLAASRSQASVAFSYVAAYLESSPVLRQQIESMTADEIRLRGGIVVGVHAGSFRTIRGKTLLAVIGDETSFWRDEASAQPDVEIFRAVAPALAASRGMFIGISTGYRKLGLLYERWRDHFGQNGSDVLVVQGSSTSFNPALNVGMVERAKAADPVAAESEWGGGFRADISAYLDDATIDAAIDLGRPLELPPRRGITYSAFTDASGGRHDFFTLAVAHKDGGDRFVCDVVRGWQPPFDPRSVVAEGASLLKDYGVRRITGDNYAAAWVEKAWLDQGVAYERSELNRSQLYLEVLPLFMRGVVSIPDHARLVRELRLLERRSSRLGKDVIDHGRNGTDDHSNSLAGVLHSLSAKQFRSYRSWFKSDDLDEAPNRLKSLWEHPSLQ